MSTARDITAPGLYDILEADYHADPCPEPSLSSSIAKMLVTQTPLHAMLSHPRLNEHYIAENKQTYDLGSAAHALLLGEPADFAIIEFDNWQTKAAKAQRDEAYAAGQIPMLAHKMEDVQLMVESAKRQLAGHEDGRIFLEPGCKSEQTLIWQEGPSWCRARIDRMSPEGRVFFDYKTTDASAHPDEWGTRAMFNLGYDVQDAFYRRGGAAVLGFESSFLFIVQERKAPYALSVISNTPTGQQIGAAKADMAIAQWGWCMDREWWPGYPKKTVYVDPPVWQKQAWLEDPAEKPSNTSEEMAKLMDLYHRPLEEDHVSV